MLLPLLSIWPSPCSNSPWPMNTGKSSTPTLARQSRACTTLLSIPGIGLLTATALVAATSGDVTHFKDARHFASWFGLDLQARRPLSAHAAHARRQERVARGQGG